MQKKLTVILVFVVLTIMVVAVIANREPAHQPSMSEAISQYDSTRAFYFDDAPGATESERAKWALLRDVMACESASRWLVVQIPGRGYDLGPCQINTYHHAVPAARKGYDLFNPGQNLLYCIELFQEYYPIMQSGKGWNPWYVTQACWEDRQRIRKEQAINASGY
jgi:hypothetical protein